MIPLTSTFLATFLLLSPVVLAFPNSIYVIRDAETPSLRRPGLTPVGLNRAEQCLPNVFHPGSDYDIGLVISCTPDTYTSACHAAVETATPLADGLGLSVDTTCGVTDDSDDDCVTHLMSSFAANSSQSILVVWDNKYIEDLFDNFDLKHDGPDFPEDAPDIIFTLRGRQFISQSSQECPDIDGPAPGQSLVTSGGPTAASNQVSGTSGADSHPNEGSSNASDSETPPNEEIGTAGDDVSPADEEGGEKPSEIIPLYYTSTVDGVAPTLTPRYVRMRKVHQMRNV